VPPLAIWSLGNLPTTRQKGRARRGSSFLGYSFETTSGYSGPVFGFPKTHGIRHSQTTPVISRLSGLLPGLGEAELPVRQNRERGHNLLK
jgi:hypothetical protein